MASWRGIKGTETCCIPTWACQPPDKGLKKCAQRRREVTKRTACCLPLKAHWVLSASPRRKTFPEEALSPGSRQGDAILHAACLNRECLPIEALSRGESPTGCRTTRCLPCMPPPEGKLFRGGTVMGIRQRDAVQHAAWPACLPEKKIFPEEAL